MSELLKSVYTTKYLEKVSAEFVKNYKLFDQKKFMESIFLKDWDGLELKMRVKRISSALYEVLPKEYSSAIKILVPSAKPFSSYQAMFFPDYVERYGLSPKDFECSLGALAELTKYSTSEFAIRPFIEKEPERVMAKMLEWSNSNNVHVRRLASEGCRPRLPWGRSLVEFKLNPTPILPILENLRNDPELYVRRSVANNLNDIGKDNPELLLKIAEQWLGQERNTDWIIKHGLRSLLKNGDQRALRLFGYSNTKYLKISQLSLEKEIIQIGSDLRFSFQLIVEMKSKVRLEYKIYYLKNNSSHNTKTFKISETELPKGAFKFTKKQSFRQMTTRRHYKGEHFISIVVNGKEQAKIGFMLQ